MQGRKSLQFFLRDFFLSCQKETPQTPKKRRFGARRRLNLVFTKLFVVGNFPSLMVNALPHRRPCVCFAYARGTNGRIMRAVSAATNGSNARFWWQLSFTLRDDHAASILNFGKSVLCLRPPAGVFLWGATPVSLGKTKEMGPRVPFDALGSPLRANLMPLYCRFTAVQTPF